MLNGCGGWWQASDNAAIDISGLGRRVGLQEILIIYDDGTLGYCGR